MKIAVLVLGGHRSGTSATAGVLGHSGVEFGANLTPPREENPRGFFEHDDIWKLHERLLQDIGVGSDEVRALPPGWPDSSVAKHMAEDLFAVLLKDFAKFSLWGLKDPRLSRLFPLWPRLLGRLDVEPRVVISLRHPLESARSLAHRNGFDLSHSLGLWLRYMLDAERATRGYRRIVLHYPDLLADWRQALRRVNSALDLGLPEPSGKREEKISSFLSADLRHQRAEHDWVGTDRTTLFGEWCDEVYRTMLSGSDELVAATLDAVAAAFEDLERKTHAFWAPVTYRNGEIRRLASTVDRLEAEAGGECLKLANRSRDEQAGEERPDAQKKECEPTHQSSHVDIAPLSASFAELAFQLKSVQNELDSVYRSRSWRVTWPLRAASSKLRGSWIR